MSNNFFVGQRVVRTYRGERPKGLAGEWPVYGRVYTISNIFLHEDTPMVELSEIYAPGNDEWTPGFQARNFRPAVDKPADIAVFTAMLKDASRKVDA